MYFGLCIYFGILKCSRIENYGYNSGHSPTIREFAQCPSCASNTSSGSFAYVTHLVTMVSHFLTSLVRLCRLCLLRLNISGFLQWVCPQMKWWLCCMDSHRNLCGCRTSSFGAGSRSKRYGTSATLCFPCRTITSILKETAKTTSSFFFKRLQWWCGWVMSWVIAEGTRKDWEYHTYYVYGQIILFYQSIQAISGAKT